VCDQQCSFGTQIQNEALVTTAIVIIGKNAYHRADTTHLLPGSPLLNGLAGLRATRLSAARRQIRNQKLLVGVVRENDYEDIGDSLHFSTNFLRS